MAKAAAEHKLKVSLALAEIMLTGFFSLRTHCLTGLERIPEEKNIETSETTKNRGVQSSAKNRFLMASFTGRSGPE